MVSKGDVTKDSVQNIAVMLANHLPFSNRGENNIATAERNARVARVSAMAPPHPTDPLDLHKQQE
jgi:hypothetical protein